MSGLNEIHSLLFRDGGDVPPLRCIKFPLENPHMLQLSPQTKRYETVNVRGKEFEVVSPRHFYASRTPDRGMGLFASVDLQPGDIWWGNSYSDLRFVERVIGWREHIARDPAKRVADEIRCFVDTGLKSLVICTEPFCRVNHGRRGVEANSDTDAYGNSIICNPVRAGEEILIPYDYEAVVSIMWKFPEFAKQLPKELKSNAAFLFSDVANNPLAKAFLDTLRA